MEVISHKVLFFISFHVNGTEWSGGAEVFAGSASDAALHVDCRCGQIIGISIRNDHDYCSGGAMASAISTTDAVGVDHAVLFDEQGASDLQRRFLFHTNSLYRSGGACFRTAHALGAAVTSLVGEFRLHESPNVASRTQYLIRTGGYAQLATGAMLFEMMLSG